MNIDQRNTVVSIGLLVIIIGLTYWLYHTITSPWEEVQRDREITEQVRHRMANIRDALRFYERDNDKFPETLDTLVVWLNTDSLMVAARDSLFKERPSSRSFIPDSLVYSPRTGNQFTYELNDTLRPNIYLLRDPDSNDRIGSLERTTLRHAASWE